MGDDWATMDHEVPLPCNCSVTASVVPSQGQRLWTAAGRLLTAVWGVTDGLWRVTVKHSIWSV